MVLRNADDNQINTAIIENYYIPWSEVVSVFGYPNPYDLFGINGFISGIPYMMMNSLFDGDPRMTHQDIKDVLDYYKNSNLPMMWFFGPNGQQTRIPSLLDDLGVELASMRVPGMVLDLNTIDRDDFQRRLDGFELIPVDPSDNYHLEMYTKIFTEAFEVDTSIREEVKKLKKQFPSIQNSLHYYVIIDGKPVTVASMIFAAGVAGIYNVATLPSFQRQGLATAVMSKLILDAMDNDYQYCILHSSERGKAVYERLGFEVQFWFKRYLLRLSDVGF